MVSNREKLIVLLVLISFKCFFLYQGSGGPAVKEKVRDILAICNFAGFPFSNLEFHSEKNYLIVIVICVAV